MGDICSSQHKTMSTHIVIQQENVCCYTSHGLSITTLPCSSYHTVLPVRVAGSCVQSWVNLHSTDVDGSHHNIWKEEMWAESQPFPGSIYCVHLCRMQFSEAYIAPMLPFTNKVPWFFNSLQNFLVFPHLFVQILLSVNNCIAKYLWSLFLQLRFLSHVRLAQFPTDTRTDFHYVTRSCQFKL